MIMELSTTSLGIATGLASASVLMGASSEMDDFRKFFLSERSDIDSILENSRQFEDEYGLNEKVGSDDDITPKPSNDNDGEKDTPSGVLGSVSGVASAVGVEAVKSWFNYKYLVVALVLGFAYKLISGNKKVIG